MEKYLRQKSLTNTEAAALLVFAFLLGRHSAHGQIANAFQQGRAHGVSVDAPQLARQVDSAQQQQPSGYSLPLWDAAPRQQGQSGIVGVPDGLSAGSGDYYGA